MPEPHQHSESTCLAPFSPSSWPPWRLRPHQPALGHDSDEGSPSLRGRDRGTPGPHAWNFKFFPSDHLPHLLLAGADRWPGPVLTRMARAGGNAQTAPGHTRAALG